MTSDTTTLRAAATALVGTVAVYFTIIAWSNLGDYSVNFQFVRHVLLMDTTFPDNELTWRAIDVRWIWHATYIFIIAWEALTAIVLWAATGLLARTMTSRDTAAVVRGRQIAVIGLTMSLLQWGLFFITIGGEWFTMWQSDQWNGNEAAWRNFTVSGVVLLFVMLAVRSDRPAGDEIHDGPTATRPGTP